MQTPSKAIHNNITEPEADTSRETRRTFVKKLAAGSAGLASGSAGLSLTAPEQSAKSYRRILGANDRVQVGFLGMGRIARNHLRSLLEVHPGRAQVVAFCDVYQKNLDYAKQHVPTAAMYQKHEDLLASKDIDAVIVCSPDHWHALHTIHACEAGKDVYVEKPISISIGEGRKMVEVATQHNRIVQVGTQQRSNEVFIAAKDLIQGGKIGDVSFVRTWNFGNQYPDGIGAPADAEPFEGLDWDRWLGPAPFVPFNENRFGAMQDEAYTYQRFSSFRWFWDYAGGMMTDWGVHLLDIVLWVMRERYPNTATASGGKFHLTDNRETPDTLHASFQFDNFICTYENRTTNGRGIDDMGYGIAFHGTKGTLVVNRAALFVYPEDNSSRPMRRQNRTGGSHSRHLGNFLECVVSRSTPTCPIETGHRSTSIAILGNLAYRSGQQVHWDGENEQISGNDAASNMLMPTYRAPWQL